MSTIHTKIKEIHNHIIARGSRVWDDNLQRFTYELLGDSVELNYLDLFELCKLKLNPKYKPEIIDYEQWIINNAFKLRGLKNRRQVVYFNDKDYMTRFQCISLIQHIDNTLIVYQRSGDTLKMLDDFIFFTYLTTYIKTKIQTIKIFYGSLHTETK